MGADQLAGGVRRALGVDVVVTEPVSGGAISEACRATLADGRVVFAKSGEGLPPGILDAEAAGLRWLAQAGPGAVGVPAILGRCRAPDVLVLAWIEPGSAGPATDERLGSGLARLHRSAAPAFGGPEDGFIGSLPQRNTPTSDDWGEFWFTRRIEPLARQARDRGRLTPGAAAAVGRLGERLASRCGPPEPPARVHGDLWSGNVLVDRDGEPWLVDPAAYGGHREVDLAMLHLFGAPGPRVVAAYEEVWPLADGWRDRQALWQLEPLLVHTVLFGGSYGPRAEAILHRYT